MPHVNHLHEVDPISGQTYLEDLICAVLQAVGLVLAIGGIATLIALAGVYGNAWEIVSISIYGGSLVLVYGASTLYHATRNPARKQLLKVIDHANIHLLIAGTYTPFLLVTLNGAWGWTLFGVVWGLSVLGVLLKVFIGRRYGAISVVLYLTMGWIAVIAVVPLFHALGVPGIAWMVAGGAIYSIGVIFYLWDRLRFNHLYWQLFVLAGSVCFYFAIMFLVLF